jgi:hypothetical protein
MADTLHPKASTKTNRKSRRDKLRIETAVVYPEASEPERQAAVFKPEHSTVMLEQTSRDIGGDHGKTLRDLDCWLRKHYSREDLEKLEPIISQLRHLHCLLFDLRQELARADLTLAERLRLARSLMNALGTYTKLWRLIGLPGPQW